MDNREKWKSESKEDSGIYKHVTGLQAANGHLSNLWNLVFYIVIGPLVSRSPRQNKAVGKLAHGVHRKGVSIVLLF